MFIRSERKRRLVSARRSARSRRLIVDRPLTARASKPWCRRSKIAGDPCRDPLRMQVRHSSSRWPRNRLVRGEAVADGLRARELLASVEPAEALDERVGEVVRSHGDGVAIVRARRLGTGAGHVEVGIIRDA
jgi:hypothetical protein